MIRSRGKSGSGRISLPVSGRRAAGPKNAARKSPAPCAGRANVAVLKASVHKPEARKPAPGFFFLLVIYFFTMSARAGCQYLSWRYVTAGRIIAPPRELPGEHRYAALSEDRRVHAVNDHGFRLWSFNLEKKPAPFLSVSPDNIIHVCTADGTLVGINKLGLEVWRTFIGFVPEGEAVYKKDGTMFLRNGTRIWGLSPRGRIKWKAEYEHAVKGIHIGPGDEICVYLSDGSIVLCDPWGKAAEVPKITDIRRFLACGEYGFICAGPDGLLTRYSWNGGKLWEIRYEPPGGNETLLALREKGFACLAGGFIRSYDFDGNAAWEGSFKRKDTADIVFDTGDTCYILAATGELFVRKPDGGEFLLYNLGRNAQDLFLSSAGTLLAGADDWILYAFSAAPGVRAGTLRETPEKEPAKAEEIRTPLSGYLNALTSSGGMENMEKALDDMKALTDTGNFMSAEREMAEVLGPLSRAGLSKPQGSALQNSALSTIVRGKTAEILGIISTPEAHTILVPMLYYERDREVLVAVLEALATLKSDADGAIAQYLTDLIRGGGLYGKDNGIAFAVLRACEGICLYQASMDPGMRELLLKLYIGDYAQFVRNGALGLLRKFIP